MQQFIPHYISRTALLIIGIIGFLNLGARAAEFNITNSMPDHAVGPVVTVRIQVQCGNNPPHYQYAFLEGPYVDGIGSVEWNYTILEIPGLGMSGQDLALELACGPVETAPNSGCFYLGIEYCTWVQAWIVHDVPPCPAWAYGTGHVMVDADVSFGTGGAVYYAINGYGTSTCAEDYCFYEPSGCCCCCCGGGCCGGCCCCEEEESEGC